MYLLHTSDLDGIGFNDRLYVLSAIWYSRLLIIALQLRENWPLFQRVQGARHRVEGVGDTWRAR